MSNYKKPVQTTTQQISPDPENTQAILSRRDFLIKSLLLAGASGILAESACACLSVMPDCVDINSVDVLVTPKWIIQDSELIIETNITTYNGYGIHFRTATPSGATVIGNQEVLYAGLTFFCKPDPGADQIEVALETSCSSVNHWTANFTFILDVTEPEENKQLIVVSQSLEKI